MLRTAKKDSTLIHPFLKTIEFPSSIDPDPSLSEIFNYKPWHTSTLNHQSIFEISVHTPGLALSRELSTVFSTPNPTVIIIIQKSYHDLIQINQHTQWERNLFYAYFLNYATLFCNYIISHGYWADMTDPCDGLPVFSERRSCIYPEVDTCAKLLKYSTTLIGSCRVLLHPKWKTRCYPGSLFTNAPLNIIECAIANINTLNNNNNKPVEKF